jgi:hypothetical protein
MTFVPGRQLWAAIAIALPAIPTLVLFVAAAGVIAETGPATGVGDLMVRALGPIVRSGVAALLTGALVAFASGLFASLLVAPWIASERQTVAAACLFLAAAVTPALLGASSFAFVWRAPYAQALMAIPYFSDRGPLTAVLIDTCAQVVRYTPLGTWLLVAITLEGDAAMRRYAQSAGLCASFFVRAELLRRWTPPLLVVAAFAFQDAFNDYVITYLALRPSEATSTELVGHFLSRIFVGQAIARSAKDASAALVQVALLSGAASAILFGMLSTAMIGAVRILRPRAHQSGTTSRSSARHGRSLASSQLPWIPVIMAAGIVAAVVQVLALAEMAALRSVIVLAPALGLSLGVAVLSWAMAILVDFAIRERATTRDGTAQRRMAVTAFVCICLGFIPPLGLAAALYTVLFGFVDVAHTDPAMGWFVAQTLRMFPIVVVLLVPAALAIEDETVWYLQVSGVRFVARVRMAFLRPFGVTHLALIMISWNFVMNEAVVSTIFQADIPAFAELIQRASSGRSAAYPLVGLLVTAEAILFGSLCVLWGLQSFRAWGKQHGPN